MDGKQSEIIQHSPGIQERREYASLEQLFASLKRGDSSYRNLIEQLPSGSNTQIDTPYSDAIYKWLQGHSQSNEDHPKDVEWIENHVRGNLMVDLGGAERLTMLTVASWFGAKGYIDVDKNISKSLPYDPTKNQIKEFQGGRYTRREDDTEIAVVKSDMLDFVARLEDESIGVYTLNGIDYGVLTDRDYRNALTAEIARTLKPGGIVFGHDFSPI